MKCTLVISDWEMTDDKFFDYMKNNREPVLDINDKMCPVDNLTFNYEYGEPYIVLECHYDENLIAN